METLVRIKGTRKCKMTCLNQKRLMYLLDNNKTKGSPDSSLAFLLRLLTKLRLQITKEKGGATKLVRVKNINLTVVAIQDTYPNQTYCIYGPSRAVELPTVVEGCCRVMVGAQLWLLRSTADKKADCGSCLESSSSNYGR